MSEGRVIPPGEVLPPLPEDSPPRRDAPDHAPPAGGGGRGRKNGKARTAADRFAVLNGFVDCSIAGLTRAELATWLVLYRDTRNGTARTSVADLARRAGTSERAVITALNRLRAKGLLTRVYKGGLNRGPSIYRVHPLAREPTAAA